LAQSGRMRPSPASRNANSGVVEQPVGTLPTVHWRNRGRNLREALTSAVLSPRSAAQPGGRSHVLSLHIGWSPGPCASRLHQCKFRTKLPLWLPSSESEDDCGQPRGAVAPSHASHPPFGSRDASLKTAATPLGPKAATGIPAHLSSPWRQHLLLSSV